MQSVHITTKVVSSNPAQGEVYSVQHSVIKTVSDLRHVGGFLRILLFPQPIKLSRYNCNVVESVCNLRQVGGFLLVLWFPLPIKMSRYNCNVVESVCNLLILRASLIA